VIGGDLVTVLTGLSRRAALEDIENQPEILSGEPRIMPFRNREEGLPSR